MKITRLSKLLLVIIPILMFVGCVGSVAVEYDEQEEKKETDINLEIEEVAEEIVVVELEEQTEVTRQPQTIPQPFTGENSFWAVYWDREYVIEEIAALYEDIDNIYHFAAYFDSENDLFIDENSASLYENINTEFPNNEWKNYITIVNDKINDDKSSSLKDSKMLYDLLSDEKNMRQHINQIVDIALNNSFDGVIIDYENIGDDMSLWDLIEEFYDLLYRECSKSNLKLRVVFEPSAPISELSINKDIGLIMMCYNLYGYHSGPGPKADADFLETLTQKMESFDGYKEFAISSGGFDWSNKEKITALTDFDAQLLCEEYGVEYERDHNSRSIYYSYKDEEDINHDVWYADSKTLNYWMNIIRENNGANISIWRLSGLDAKNLSELMGE